MVTAPTTAQVGEHYDELDHFYRDIWGEHLHHGVWHDGSESPEEAAIRLIEQVAESAAVERDVRVCDVGAGYGATARYLSEQYAAHVTAVTLSKVQHRYARSQDEDHRVDYVLGDWFDNAFPDGAFDVIIAIESTAHMADKPGFFEEACRLLRPGGRLVVCAWLTDAQPSSWQVRHLLDPICREGRLPGLGSMSEYRQWIGDAGLALTVAEDWSDYVRRTWAICLRRIFCRLFRDSRYLRFVMDSSRKNRRFALTVPRMWLAYTTGALHYGFFAAEKPPGS
jgi:tocopherol O-methyltransferase